MKITTLIRHGLPGIVIAGSGLLLAACAADAVKAPGAAKVRAELTQLQSNPDLASRAPLAIQDAETAVVAAEKPQTDPALASHLVYLADRKVQVAQAQAQTKYDEDQLKTLGEQNAKIQLDARTREADKAKLKNDSLEQQLAALQAKKTDRGMVLTLGDVLFSTGRSDLKPGGVANLDRLVSFLGQAPDRSVRIEGHTDNVGSQAYNQTLSQKRADSVAMYLTGRGIASSRVSSIGEGLGSPVADNATEAGRQANRRVEVIIQNPAP